jgi:hypothetical protein
MFRKFKSLGQSAEYAYSYDSTAWDSHAPIESHFRVFKNYGDGLTAHSPDWSITVDLLSDYLMSLAAAMLEDDELARDLFYTIWRRPDAKHIAWAASVIYKKPKDGEYGKPRYFSAKEMKVSASPSKQYDKRYEEVRDVHDGSANSIFRILVGEYADGMEKYATASAVRDWLMEHDGYMELPAEFLKWFNGDREKARQLRDAYEACKHVTEAYRLRSAVESSLENYKRRIAPKPASEPEAPAPEAEAAPPPCPPQVPAA